MSLYDGSRFRARFVDIAADGKKVFAVACGESVCTGTKFNGRFGSVNASDGKKIFYTASEGCQLPLDPLLGLNLDETCVTEAAFLAAAFAVPFMVERDVLPPYGLSRVIKVTALSLLGCIEKHCLTGFLIYNEPTTHTTPCGIDIPAGQGWWSGCVAGVDVELWLDATRPAGEEIRVCLDSPCFSDDPEFQTITGYLPYAGCTLSINSTIEPGQLPVPGTGCCECDNSEAIIGITARSYCGAFRMGRFLGVHSDGKKVFGVSDCQEPDTCGPPAQDCCLLYRGCPLTATVSATGCCADLAGVYELVPVNVGLGVSEWSTLPNGLISACGRAWVITLNCVAGVWTINFFSVDPGCNCGPVSGTASEPESCYPLELAFTLPIACAEFPSEDCSCEPTLEVAIAL